ncbi:ANTAR domain-containing protein [Arthrobacter sp. CJ23]|uniref:ANTAR domain-containing protein n=1 Tax=Arthrobacter sp. CJ23 TaxID=2972479 RepID=UPI00215C1949|nr:ANTAR domain-containing protein [Arthrobacter sp. CJ23]UVJ41242.1 ANTAR domain-containing protein [Arthrobacter sp. CJ23]
MPFTRAPSPGTLIEAAESYEHIASGALRLSVRIARLSESRQNLMAAMESRTVIDLAAGVIMAENRCSQNDALTILKNASNYRNIKLRDLAASIVASISNDHKVITRFED